MNTFTACNTVQRSVQTAETTDKENPMPVITIAMHSTTEDVRKDLIEGLTAAAVAATHVPAEKFVVFVEEYATDAIGLGGRTLKPIKAAQQ